MRPRARRELPGSLLFAVVSACLLDQEAAWPLGAFVIDHHRWLCATCRREWVFALHWKEEDGCPGCHSSQISRITYQPEFPGGDIQRTVLTEPQRQAVEAAPEYVRPAGLDRERYAINAESSPEFA